MYAHFQINDWYPPSSCQNVDNELEMFYRYIYILYKAIDTCVPKKLYVLLRISHKTKKKDRYRKRNRIVMAVGIVYNLQIYT